MDIILASIGHTALHVLNNDFQYDISDLIKQYNVDLDRFIPSTINAQREIADGGIYGLPVGNSSAGLFYNKDLFDQFAVGYPSDDMTWDEAYEMAQRLTREENGTQYYGLKFSFQHMKNVNQLSQPLVDPETNKVLYMDDNTIKMIQNFLRFYQIPGSETEFRPTLVGRTRELFRTERTLAMFPHLSGEVNQLPDDMNWDVAALPQYADLPGVGPQSYPSYAYLTSSSKNKRQAFEIIDYLTGEEFQLQRASQGFMSSLQGEQYIEAFLNSSEKYQGKNIRALFPETFADPAPPTIFEDIANKHYISAIDQILRDGKDINTALREAEEQANLEIQAALEDMQ